MLEKISCYLLPTVLTVILILTITFTDQILNKFPIITTLFTDPLNYTLLTVLVILLLCANLTSGIIFALIVLYLSVMVQRRNRLEGFTNPTKYTGLTYNQVRSDSEFLYDITKPFPNDNIKPLNPNNVSTGYNEPRIPLPTPDVSSKQSLNDFITQINEPNRECFDVNGCRYDFKNSPQNLTQYGPPLAQCGTYKGSNTNCTGTVFYPLHA